jgi:hypothetical protein
LVIAKPTGLAVGDLMVAGIWADRDGGSSAAISTLSGWTSQISLNTGSGNGAISVQTKVADSGDVAASDFTFTGTGSTTQMHMCGYITRISGFGNNAGTASAASGSTSSTLTVTGFTPSPTIASALYLIFAGRAYSSSVTVNSVSMATDNPTWTEQNEVGVIGSTTSSNFAFYTATRVATTATGDFTITYSATDNTRSGAAIIALNPSVSGSVTPTTTAYAYAYTPVQSGMLTINSEGATTNLQDGSLWSTDTKPSTAWTNPNK